MSMLSFQLMPGSAALLQFGLTVGLYPALAVLFGRAYRGIADPDQA